MPHWVKVSVPATTANLGPGFDVLGLALSLENEVEISVAPRMEVVIQGEGAGELPTDARNAVWEAMRLAFERAGKPTPPLRILCRNRLPLARGLGSSAAVRVAGLAAANAWLGDCFPRATLIRWSVELEGHPDNVVPAWVGGLTVAVMERQEPLFVRLDPPAGLQVVVALPDFPLPTEKARRALPTHYSRADALFNLGRVALLTAALAQGRLDLLRAAMQDRVHEPYRSPLVPGLEEVRQAALDAGALGAALSGAGPSLVAFTIESASQIRDAMVAAWESKGIRARGWILLPQREGTRLWVE